MAPFGVGDDDKKNAPDFSTAGAFNPETLPTEIKNLEDKLEDESKKDKPVVLSDLAKSVNVEEVKVDNRLDKIGMVLRNKMDSRSFVQAMNEIKAILSS